MISYDTRYYLYVAGYLLFRSTSKSLIDHDHILFESQMQFLSQDINRLMDEIDKDRNGAIDFEEFLHMMTAKIGERDSKEELTRAFRIIDQDNNVKFLISYVINV